MKALITKWIHYIAAVLGPLGVWGVMGFAFIDAAMFGMPIDAVVCGYSYAKPSHLLLYSLGAAVGSALGSLVVYAIGYKGGEVMLKKRMGEDRFNRITGSFEKREFLLLTVISVLPPPTPFKLFVLASGMVEMRPWRFLAAISLGRFVRFTIESILVVRYGPHVIALLAEVLRHHLTAAIVAIITIAVLAWWFARLRKARLRADGTVEFSE